MDSKSNHIVGKPIHYLFRYAEAETVYHKLVAPYFSQAKAKLAVGGIAALNSLTIGGGVYFTYLWRDIMNHLGAGNAPAFFSDMNTFVMYAVGMVGVGVSRYVITQRLTLDWKNWAKNQAFEEWSSPHHRARLVSMDAKLEPEQRITGDINTLVQTSESLSVGFVTNAVNLGTFSTILFSISPKLFAGTMAAGVAVTWGLNRFNQSMVTLNNQATAAENAHRNAVTTARTHRKEIALWGGEEAVQKTVKARLDTMGEVGRKTIQQNGIVNGITGVYENASIAFPFLAVASDYLRPDSGKGVGDFSLSASAAFNARMSLNWGIYNQTAMIQWSAAAKRLTQFYDGCVPKLDADNKLPVYKPDQPNVELAVRSLVLRVPRQHDEVQASEGTEDRRVLSDDVTFDQPLTSGDRFVLLAESGAGKSTLFDMLAGLVHHEDGEIEYSGVTGREEIIFVPQRQFLMTHDLREELIFPRPDRGPITDQDMIDVLNKVGLSDKATLLQQDKSRGSELVGMSGGELQRLNFARLLLHKPSIIGLDEATSALQPEAGVELYQMLFRELPNSIVLSIVHRPELIDLHNKEGRLTRESLTVQSAAADRGMPHAKARTQTLEG